MRIVRMPRRRAVAVGAVASLLLLGGSAYAATVPNPDPCDPQYKASYQGLRNYMDCRLDRIERAIPEKTVTVTTTATPTTTTTPSTTTTSPTTTTTATTTTTTTTNPPAVLDLPRVPWEGGADYYNQFADAKANGWADPNHFPVAIWWDVFNSDAEVKWDKAHGINTYVVTNDSTQGAEQLLEQNGMSWIGGQLPGMTRDSKAWVGDFLDDEVDGRYSCSDGTAFLQGLVDRLPDHDKLRYANYTSSLVNIWFDDNCAKKYASDFTDAVSLDQYVYSADFCSWQPFPTDYFINPLKQDTCRTSHSYGVMVDSLRQRDAMDGKLQPVWNFVEDVSQGNQYRLTTDQVRGAAWASLIHEARGLIWFNNSFAGDCATGNAIRTAQLTSWACDAQIEAMGQVNNQIQRLAPVLNTQSYRWDFGGGVDTMLKAHDGDVYIFTGTDGHAGEKTLTLPNGLAGSAEVIDEGRSVPIVDGKITDGFSSEATVHIYRVHLS